MIKNFITKYQLKHLMNLYILLNIIMISSVFMCKPLYTQNEAFFWSLFKLIIIVCNIIIPIAHIINVKLQSLQK